MAFFWCDNSKAKVSVTEVVHWVVRPLRPNRYFDLPKPVDCADDIAGKVVVAQRYDIISIDMACGYDLPIEPFVASLLKRFIKGICLKLYIFN